MREQPSPGMQVIAGDSFFARKQTRNRTLAGETHWARGTNPTGFSAVAYSKFTVPERPAEVVIVLDRRQISLLELSDNARS